jgi:hypothetical protein
MAAEKDFSHYVTRSRGIGTYRLAEEAATVSKENTNSG